MHGARAQVASPPVTVHGVAYDSLHHAPLSGAFIAIVGSGRTAVSDERGLFVFDSVAPGTYTFAMQHDVLDSIGLSGASARAIITTGRDTVTIAVPSFGALWHAACHTPTPPRDSALVFGTVRGIGGQRAAAGAAVSASWFDVGYDRAKGITQQLWRLEVSSDSTGGYSLCGVPTTTGVRLRAATDSAATGLIDLPPLGGARIQRWNLVLGPKSDSTTRGAIAGLVTGNAGTALRDARVATEGVPEARTGLDGRFLLRGVPVGTQQIEVRAIGLAPVVATVDVVAGATAEVNVQLTKLTVLDSVRVTASTVRRRLVTEFEERRKSGWGVYRDSTTIAKHGTLMAVFAEMPSVTVRTRRGGGPIISLPSSTGAGCVATLWIDRIRSNQADLAAYRPQDIAAVEVYTRFMTTPPEFQGRGCGSVVVWTKRLWP